MFVRLSSLIAAGALCSLVAAEPTSTSHDLPQLVARDGPGSVVTSPAGLQWYSPDLQAGATPRNVSDYTCYSGPATNFPPMSDWISFCDMWQVQRKYALTAVNDTQEEIDDIYYAIKNISVAAKVDARVILSVIIHESFGNVNVPCTYAPGNLHNCGLMQSYNATDTSYDPKHPAQSITQMIIDGTQGTPAGPGLVQLFNNANDTLKEADGNVYKVFRAYNSGSVDPDDLSDGGGALNSYVSDMANFLQGWNGYGSPASKCNFTGPTKTAPTCASTAFVAAPTATTSGSTPDCCTWYTVKSGDSCYTVDLAAGITFPQLRSWNTYIDENCDNLPANMAVCVNGYSNQTSSSSTSISSATSTSTSAQSSTSSTSTPPATCVSSGYVAPPTRTQEGSTADCCSWYTVQSGDSCYSIDVKNNITFAQLQAWNTYIDKNCDNIWAQSAVCIDSNIPVGGGTTSSTSVTSTTKPTSSSRSSTTSTATSSVPATCVSSGYVAPPAATQSGSTARCCDWHVVQSGDSCYLIDQQNKISFNELQAWNTYIDTNCDNLWLKTAVCIDSDVPVGNGTTTTSTSSSEATSASSASSSASVSSSRISSSHATSTASSTISSKKTTSSTSVASHLTTSSKVSTSVATSSSIKSFSTKVSSKA